MYCQYREKIYICGDYLDIDIVPIYTKQRSRGKKTKPTSLQQRILNAHNAEKRLSRLVRTNFTNSDIYFTVTYAEAPESLEQARAELYNFLRRVKRRLRKMQKKELKYIATTEIGAKNGRIHHHLIMSCDLPIAELAAIWGKGYTNAKALQFDEQGIDGLLKYFCKQRCSYKKWSTSKNLKQPEIIERCIISQKKVRELKTYCEDRKLFEELYKGYFFVDCRPFYNSYNNDFYLYIRMYKPKRKRKKASQYYWRCYA